MRYRVDPVTGKLQRIHVSNTSVIIGGRGGGTTQQVVTSTPAPTAEVYSSQYPPDYDTDYVYVGYAAPSGAWYIYRRTRATNLRQYATGVSSYSTNWTNRGSLTYV